MPRRSTVVAPPGLDRGSEDGPKSTAGLMTVCGSWLRMSTVWARPPSAISCAVTVCTGLTLCRLGEAILVPVTTISCTAVPLAGAAAGVPCA